MLDDIKKIGRAAGAMSTEHEFEKWQEEGMAAILRYAEFTDGDEIEVARRALQGCDILSKEAGDVMAKSNSPEAMKYLGRITQGIGYGVPETTAVLDKSKGKRKANDKISTEAGNESGSSKSVDESSTEHSRMEKETLADMERMGRAFGAASSHLEFLNLCVESLAAFARYKEFCEEYGHPINPRIKQADDVLSEQAASVAHKFFKSGGQAETSNATKGKRTTNDSTTKAENKTGNLKSVDHSVETESNESSEDKAANIRSASASPGHDESSTEHSRMEKETLADMERIGRAFGAASSQNEFMSLCVASMALFARYEEFCEEHGYPISPRIKQADEILTEQAESVVHKFLKLDGQVEGSNEIKTKGTKKTNDSTSANKEKETGKAGSVDDSVERESNESSENKTAKFKVG